MSQIEENLILSLSHAIKKISNPAWIFLNISILKDIFSSNLHTCNLVKKFLVYQKEKHE